MLKKGVTRIFGPKHSNNKSEKYPRLTDTFQVPTWGAGVQNLFFPGATDMIDQGNQLKAVLAYKKWS